MSIQNRLEQELANASYFFLPFCYWCGGGCGGVFGLFSLECSVHAPLLLFALFDRPCLSFDAFCLYVVHYSGVLGLERSHV